MATLKTTIVEDDLGDEDVVVPHAYSITSYGADYTVDGLVKRIREKDIFVPPFQRKFVWTIRQASRFVESLLLGLPVPGIFLSRDSDSQRLLVIDGQQRLRSLQYFYSGTFRPTKRPFALVHVQKQFEGVIYKKLKAEDRRRLDDSILHATIVKQDVPSDDDSSIYQVFARLNTGGTQLQPQEIRAALYHGDFNDTLKSLNDVDSWRSIYGNLNRRLRDQELILRFLALYFESASYARPMEHFLNKYMARNRRLQRQAATVLRDTFVPTADLIHRALGRKAFRPKRALNAAVFDAVMVGLAKMLSQGKSCTPKDVRRRYNSLLKNKTFILASSKSTADEDNVKKRLRLATRTFA